MVLASAMASSPALATKRVVLYDPDANHEAILNIAFWFDRYLKGVDPELEFQAVQGRAELETLVAAPDTYFALISSDLLKRGANLPLTPLLVPALGGDVYYVKKLVDRGDGRGDGDVTRLTGKTVAVTVTGENGELPRLQLRASPLLPHIDATGAILISVSKDVDALLALSFGQVDAALVTPSSIAVVQRINPAMGKSFRVLSETTPLLRSPLCATPRATVQERRRLVDILMRMAADANGRRAMQVMGFDSWVAFEPGMLEK